MLAAPVDGINAQALGRSRNDLWPTADGEKLPVMTVTTRPFSLAREITPLQQTGRRAGHAYRPRS